MEAWLLEYLPILIFIGIAVGLSAVIIAASWIVGHQKPDPEKNHDRQIFEQECIHPEGTLSAVRGRSGFGAF